MRDDKRNGPSSGVPYYFESFRGDLSVDTEQCQCQLTTRVGVARKFENHTAAAIMVDKLWHRGVMASAVLYSVANQNAMTGQPFGMFRVLSIEPIVVPAEMVADANKTIDGTAADTLNADVQPN